MSDKQQLLFFILGSQWATELAKMWPLSSRTPQWGRGEKQVN